MDLPVRGKDGPLIVEYAFIRKILVSWNSCPQFWGRKWLRQVYGRLEKMRPFCRKSHVHKIPRFRGGYFGFWGGGTLRLLNALNSEDRGLKVRFSLATIAFDRESAQMSQILSSQGKNAPSNPYPHYLVRLVTSRECRFYFHGREDFFFACSPETFCEYFFRVCLGILHWKWRGFLVNFFLVSVSPRNEARKIRGKFGAKFGSKSGTKIWKIRGTFVLQLFWPKDFSDFNCSGSPHGFSCHGLRGARKKWPKHRT